MAVGMPGKVSLIWSSAKVYDGVCLNSALIPGPLLLIQLPTSGAVPLSTIPLAVSGYVNEMFHQVKVF